MKSSLAIALVLGCAGLLMAEEGEASRPVMLLVEYRGVSSGRDETVEKALDYTRTAAEAFIIRRGMAPVYVEFDREYAEQWIKAEDLRDVCAQYGAAYALGLRCFYRDERLFWRYDLYSAEEDAVLAADAFAVVLIAGVSAPGVVDNSIARLERNWDKSAPSQSFDGRLADVEGRRFVSRQEGVEVIYGPEEAGLSAGTIANGALDAAPVPFVEGAPVYATLTKPGYWPREIELPAERDGEEIVLPGLLKKTRHSLALLNGFREGAAFTSVEFEYRFHPLPDRLFLQADWAVQPRPASQAEGAPYQELRVGAGLYILPRNGIPFRLLAGTGLALVFSSDEADFQSDPLWLGAELHFSQWAVVSALRFPSLMGYDRDIFGGGKIGTDSYCFTIGVMLKW
ncbi:MAG: hypothetical protein LBD08_07955 [Treponema sp.]|jgi:hypothetical protein|nr:hypothetical protein [Treponema sp.]